MLEILASHKELFPQDLLFFEKQKECESIEEILERTEEVALLTHKLIQAFNLSKSALTM